MTAAVAGLAVTGNTPAASGATDFDDPDEVYAGLGVGPAHVLRCAGGSIRVVFAQGGGGLNKAMVMAWIRRAAGAMAAYFDRFPIADMGLLVVAQPGTQVGHATTYGYRGSATLIHVGVDADFAAFARDWVLVHEMLHCALPNLPRRALWLQEGNATYIEPIARARVGQLAVSEVWRQSLVGMPGGQPHADEAGMDGTMRHDRLYWGGATFWLVAEIAIHDHSLGRASLRDAMIACNQASGGNNVEWTPEQLMAVGDQATRTTALSRLYARFAYGSAAIDMAAVFRRLGIALIGDQVIFDDSAPLARFRAALTQPRS